MIVMVTPRVQIPKARSVVPAKKDFLEMEKKVAAVGITMRRSSNDMMTGTPRTTPSKN